MYVYVHALNVWEFIGLDLHILHGFSCKQACADVIEQGIEQGAMTINYKVFEMLVQVHQLDIDHLDGFKS